LMHEMAQGREKSNWGPPMSYAAKLGRDKIIDALYEAGATDLGTALAGATLLHMCVDYDEMEIARWLLERGMNVDAKAAVDADGFGGHTALFATVVSQPNFWMNYQNRPQVAPFTQLLLDHGADPNVRASLRKQLNPGYGPDTMHEYRDVTALSWGERFHRKIFVSAPAMRLIVERGGHA
jgi:ankyrin repeat protein